MRSTLIRRRKKSGGGVFFTATVTPVPEEMLPGQAVNTVANYATITNTSNYTSSAADGAATIASATFQINSVDVTLGTDTVAVLDVARIRVEDSEGNVKFYIIDAQVGQAVTGTGAVLLGSTTASGTATKLENLTASGAATLGVITASGSANIQQNLTASGTPTLGSVQATGVANLEGALTASGSTVTGSILADGSASVTANLTASGTPTLGAITADGSATVAAGTPAGAIRDRTNDPILDRSGNFIEERA